MTGQPAASATPTVFVVDDDDDVRMAMCRMLEGAGFQVEPHGHGQDFLVAYSADRPGCLVIDQTMPGMTGVQVLEELETRGLSLPFILLTGSGTTTLRNKMTAKGAVEYLEKPVDGQYLIDCVRRALKLGQQ